MQIEIYSARDKDLWNTFVLESKNGTFLHLRDYMEYHSHRFVDYSLLIYNDKKQLIAVMPANKQDTTVCSHAGLSYGGIIAKLNLDTPTFLEVFVTVCNFLKEQHIDKLLYKTIPSIYHKIPAEEDRYALFLCNAQLIRRDLLSVINNAECLSLQERRRRMVNKASKASLTVNKTSDYKQFWEILTNNLETKYDVKPVHALEEILLLASRFPDNIKLFGSYQQNKLLAGVLIYETDTVAHAQYISASDEGKALGALDIIFYTLISEIYRNKRYFDFGISNENQGRTLNKGLIEQKEGFGARGILHDYYQLNLQSFQPDILRNVL